MFSITNNPARACCPSVYILSYLDVFTTRMEYSHPVSASKMAVIVQQLATLAYISSPSISIIHNRGLI
jgi:hypothetical protein